MSNEAGHSALRTPHSAVRSPQSAVRSPQSAVRSPQSAVRSPQSKHRLGSALFATLLLAALGLSPTAATAAPPASEPQDEIIAALMQLFEMSEAQVRRQLAAQAAAAKVDSTLSHALGSAYAGAWYDQASLRLVVLTTDANHHPRVREAGALPVAARRSLTQLHALADALYVEASAGGWDDALAVSYLDYPNNALVLEVLPEHEEAVRGHVATMGLEAGAVRIERSTGRAVPLSTIYDGNAFENRTHTNSCSVGFAVQEGGYLTAAHCGEGGDSAAVKVSLTEFQPLGYFANSTFPPTPEPPEPGIPEPRQDNPDQAWVSLLPGWTASTQIVNSSGRHIIGQSLGVVGAWVCRYGKTTGGPHCGSIQANNARLSGFGVVNGVPLDAYPMIKVSACSNFGDSGGPLILPDARKVLPGYAYAVGTLSGGPLPHGCPGSGPTYFAPVNTALQRFGLHLKVLSGPK